MNNMKLSVIFPVRVSTNRQYILDNIERIFSIKNSVPEIEYILIDSGSIAYFSEKIKNLCEQHQVKYVYQDTRSQVFSIGYARDFGAQIANGDCILFLDVDLVFDEMFFNKILQEIESRELKTNVTDYFCIPCFYLDEEYSNSFLNDGNLRSSNKFYQLRNNYENGNKLGVQSFAPATSLLVINRMHFLSIGGHRKEFSGHGSEDFELVHRLATYARKYHRTYNYYLDKKSYNSIEYEGFRAYFSMAGYSVYNNNLFAVHMWHPRPKDKYQTSILQNKEKLQLFMKDFDEGKTRIEPLEDLTSKETTLIFGKRKDKIWLGIRQILPLLGQLDYISEYDLDVGNIKDFLQYRGVTRLLFSNPYGNEKRLSIYLWAKENNFPHLVFERGALPDSWFLDEGFNADSSSYNYEKWDKELTIEESLDVEDYINSIIQSSSTLEKNDNFNGGVLTKNIIDTRHKVGNRRILFVALQRPNDTVVKYFSGTAKSFEGFIIQLNEIVNSLDSNEWFIIVKKHPLEPSFPDNLKRVDNMILINNEYHIHDLLYIADKVLLINSGVGLLGLLFGKPVIHMGEAFYSHPEINKYARNSSEAVDFIKSGFKISKSVRAQLIHYLKNDFYSFAKVYYSERIEKNGSKLSIAENFIFYQIRGVGDCYIDIDYRENPIPLSSTIYGLFLSSIIRKSKQEKDIFISPAEIMDKLMSNRDNSNIKKIIDVKVNKSKDLKTNAKELTKEQKPEKINIIKNEDGFLDKIIRKRKKFSRDPYNFFGDSKNPIVNKGKYFYRNKK